MIIVRLSIQILLWKNQLNELTVDREDEEFLDAIEQQLDTPSQADPPAELNVLTNDYHHVQGW